MILKSSWKILTFYDDDFTNCLWNVHFSQNFLKSHNFGSMYIFCSYLIIPSSHYLNYSTVQPVNNVFFLILKTVEGKHSSGVRATWVNLISKEMFFARIESKTFLWNIPIHTPKPYGLTCFHWPSTLPLSEIPLGRE